MATTRLTFLYPHLFRGSATIARWGKGGPTHEGQSRCLTTMGRRDQTFVERHGKAVEPFLGPGSGVGNGKEREGVKVDVLGKEGEMGKGEPKAERRVEGNSVRGNGNGNGKNMKEDKDVKGKHTKETKARSGKAVKLEKKADKVAEPSSAAPLSAETQAAAVLPGDPPSEPDRVQEAQTTKDSEPILASTSPNPTNQSNPQDAPLTAAPLETVLQMPPPQSVEAENDGKPPHLQTPPYVHHFDTYTLVQQVERGGYTTEQSITAMKAVRSLLALNLDVAKKGLVSKSDVENETYLFRAACSELKTEVQNNRKARDEEMRRERTHLQHEAEILNQKMTQELLTLKDELKGMFDDRKMGVRSEQRGMESKIQELNYKITVLLNSDSKSEVEGLRWVLTRRSVMGILFMAFMVLTSLRYASYRSHEEEVRRKRERELVARVEESSARDGGAGGGGSGNGEARGAVEVLAANGG